MSKTPLILQVVRFRRQPPRPAVADRDPGNVLQVVGIVEVPVGDDVATVGAECAVAGSGLPAGHAAPPSLSTRRQIPSAMYFFAQARSSGSRCLSVSAWIVNPWITLAVGLCVGESNTSLPPSFCRRGALARALVCPLPVPGLHPSSHRPSLRAKAQDCRPRPSCKRRRRYSQCLCPAATVWGVSQPCCSSLSAPA